MAVTVGSGRATRARPRRRTGGVRTRSHGGIGLALAGGGPLGGIYEVGALLALADSLDGIDFTRLDAYVGVSSGGFVAAALANGISPAQMYRLFIEDGADAALKPEIFLRPALGEFCRCAAALPGLVARATVQYLRDPFHRGVLESFSTLAHAIPTGVFDNRAIDEFLSRLFAAPGRTNDFRELPRKLFLVATNLDTGAPVVFGPRQHAHVPISRAIEASSALPGLFPPVAIDGEHYVDGALNKTLHASVALDEGVSLLLCVNPLVPFDASAALVHGHRRGLDKLNEGGLSCSGRPSARSSTRACASAWSGTGTSIPMRASCCSSRIARTPTCSSRTSSATGSASAFARSRSPRPGRASRRAPRHWPRSWESTGSPSATTGSRRSTAAYPRR
jgi:predicted acylesterase/phospholipase RssA